jgi:flagellar basal body rod protein FlgG
MDRGLYSGVAALNVAERRIESITANLANVGGTGFKRLRAFTTSLAHATRGPREPQLVSRQSVAFDQGTLIQTDNEYDLALQGPGFFAVEGLAGEVYTRNGRFRIDESGVLQTLDGLAVAWVDGRATIDPDLEPPQIDVEGNVMQDGSVLGQIKVVDFVDPNQLQRDALGFFHAPGSLEVLPNQAEVHQGSLEGSNVSPVDEMTALIVAQRRFESAARVISSIEQSYKRLTTAR